MLWPTPEERRSQYFQSLIPLPSSNETTIAWSTIMKSEGGPPGPLFQFQEILEMELDHRPKINPVIPRRNVDGATLTLTSTPSTTSDPSMRKLIADLAAKVGSLLKDNVELKSLALSTKDELTRVKHELTLVKEELTLLRKERADTEGGAGFDFEDGAYADYDGGKGGDDVHAEKTTNDEKNFAEKVAGENFEENVQGNVAVEMIEVETVVEKAVEEETILEEEKDVGGLEKLAQVVSCVGESAPQTVASPPRPKRNRMPSKYNRSPYGYSRRNQVQPKKKAKKGEAADPSTQPILVIDLSGVRAHFKELTKEEDDLVKQVLKDGAVKDGAEVSRRDLEKRDRVIGIHYLAGVEITPGLIYQSLGPRKCVGDGIIDLYCALLKDRELDPRNEGLFYNCHFLSPHFYTQLTKGGYDFGGVKDWCSRQSIGCMQDDAEKIFFPIHYGSPMNHWALAVIDNTAKKFTFFDSMGKHDREVLETLARFYTDDAVQICEKKDFDLHDWAYEEAVDYPLQENTWDCGMFMLKYIDFLCHRSDPGFPFDQQHMTYFRRRIASDCIKRKVDAWV